MIRTYSELMALPTFLERFKYLNIKGKEIGVTTFGKDRYLNQLFYTSNEWLTVRDQVIVRDNGNDLAVKDQTILGVIIVHHMNAITVEDIVNGNPDILDPEFLISTSLDTHNAIHYGLNSQQLPQIANRVANDTCPWKG